MAVLRSMLAGVLSVAAGLGVAELVSAPIDPQSAPFRAVGSMLIDESPNSWREWAIEQFGTNDKPALFIGIGVAVTVLAAVAGMLQVYRPPWGRVLVLAFAVFGAVVALNRPGAELSFLLPTLAAAAISLGGLGWFGRELSATATHLEPDEEVKEQDPTGPPAVLDRRRFGVAAGALGVVAVGGYFGGRRWGTGSARVNAERSTLVLPTPAATVTVPGASPGASMAIPQRPVPEAIDYLTSADDFYRIDTALAVPQLTTGDWSLRIHGMVGSERRINWDELIAMPSVEELTTLTCVSNEVGGDLISNARWLGVPMTAVLDLLDIDPSADLLLSKSVDGWTAGTPLEAIRDGRVAMLAFAMNGEPLPAAHGYPVRQVVSGLYGYVSATKWVTDWKLTRFEDDRAYWTDRGWSARGPIKTASRIDTPSSGARLDAGRTVIAGVAWAQNTGISKVEVQLDGGPWLPANLAPDYSINTWRQWWIAADVGTGTHRVLCRAFDATGAMQTEDEQGPVPDGATGWHGVTFQGR